MSSFDKYSGIYRLLSVFILVPDSSFTKKPQYMAIRFVLIYITEIKNFFPKCSLLNLSSNIFKMQHNNNFVVFLKLRNAHI